MSKDISYKQLFFILCIVVLFRLLFNLCLVFWLESIANISHRPDGVLGFVIYAFTGAFQILTSIFLAPIYFFAGRCLVRRKYLIGKRKIIVSVFSCFAITMLLNFIVPKIIYYGGIISAFLYTVNLMFFLLGFADFIEC